MGKYFGTDGVRGKANQFLTPELAFALGRAAASVLHKDNEHKINQIVIGKDTRISGDMLEAALSAGICSVGVQPILLGIIPTPGVAVICQNMQLPGVVISASHNNFADNGIKFFSAQGYKLPDSVEDEIEYLIDNPDSIEICLGEDIASIDCLANAIDIYEEHLKKQHNLNLQGWKIVVDSAHGAASGLAQRLLASMGADIISIGDAPNGYNINDGCGSTQPKLLMEMVIKEKAQLGIALDGDADRIIVVDENGKVVDGDKILAICAKDMKEKNRLKNDLLIVTVMSNMGLNLYMQSLGVKVLDTQVGDRYILEKMLETGAVLGGEQSGHIIFGEYNTTGDGLAGALYILKIMTESQKSLSVLAEDMQLLPQVLLNVPVTEKSGWQDDADIFSAYNEAQAILDGQGRVLLRPSGTEPVLRVMAEGQDKKQLTELVHKIAAIIHQKRGLLIETDKVCVE